MTYNPGIQVELSDMPAWVKAEVALHIKSRRNLVCRIHPVENEVSIGATWHDNARQVIIARNVHGETITARGGYYDSIINFTEEEMIGHQGGTMPLPQDGQMLRLCIFYKVNNVDLYIRRDGPYMNLIKGISDGAQLTQIQLAVLQLYTGCKSSYRKQHISSNHIPQSLVNVVTRELEELGMVKVNKAGAVRVTIEGKRMSEQCKREWSWYKWSDQYSWRTRKFTGFPADIIDEYRDCMREDIARRKA